MVNDDSSPKLMCLTSSSGEVAGLFFGDGVIEFEHPSIDSAIVGAPGDPIDVLGVPTPFLIERADGPFDPLVVVINGVPTELPFCS